MNYIGILGELFKLLSINVSFRFISLILAKSGLESYIFLRLNNLLSFLANRSLAEIRRNDDVSDPHLAL